jgi:hypothetical protein
LWIHEEADKSRSVHYYNCPHCHQSITNSPLVKRAQEADKAIGFAIAALQARFGDDGGVSDIISELENVRLWH